MKRIAVAVVVLAFVGAFAWVLTDSSGDGAKDRGGLDEGSATLLEETLVTYRGKPVVVNYWATWCVPCRSEMPHIVAASKRYAGQVRFLGVDVEDDRTAAKEFAEEFGMTFRSLFDPDREIVRAQKLLGLPATQFYDAEGKLSFVKQGEIRNEELIEKIEEVLRVSR